ncbi:MAG: cation-translocating P-type ATPase [Oscillospiraceae bacterium]|nr:cation-translocating P-type ATPase [Oscillospiraceae bacterium]
MENENRTENREELPVAPSADDIPPVPPVTDDDDEDEAPRTGDEDALSDEFIKEFFGKHVEPAQEKEQPASGIMGVITAPGFINNAIRILAGLICLIFSRMVFVPDLVKLILAIAALILCGIPIVLNAIKDVTGGKFVSENVIIIIAAILGFGLGRQVDAVILCILADVGFALRDNLLQWFSDEAHIALNGQSLDDDPDLLDGYVKLVDRFFTPAILVIVVLVALFSILFAKEALSDWLYRAIIILVAACPCAFALLTALTFDFGKSDSVKKGIQFTNVRSIRSTAKLTSLIFNKTGGVTEGKYRISGIYPVRISESQLLDLAACGEVGSKHPLAEAIRSYASSEFDESMVERFVEKQGSGCIVQLKNEMIVSVGNLELMEKLGVKGELVPGNSTSVFVAVGKTYMGRIDFEDYIKPGMRETVSRLKKQGISSVSLMTGDNTLSATRIGREVGINEIYADYTPKDKRERIEYIRASQDPDDMLGYVEKAGVRIEGDDKADLRIILGQVEEPENGTVVIPSGEVSRIPGALKAAKTISARAGQSAIILLAAKVVSVIMALTGLFSMVAVVVVDIAAVVGAAFYEMLIVGKDK